MTEFWIRLWTAIHQEHTLFPEVAVYMFCPEDLLQNSAKLAEKHLRPTAFSFTEKGLYRMCFLMNSAKIFRATFHGTPKDDSFFHFNDLHLIHCPWNDDITISAKSSILGGFRMRFYITQNLSSLIKTSEYWARIKIN